MTKDSLVGQTNHGNPNNPSIKVNPLITSNDSVF